MKKLVDRRKTEEDCLHQWYSAQEYYYMLNNTYNELLINKSCLHYIEQSQETIRKSNNANVLEFKRKFKKDFLRY